MLAELALLVINLEVCLTAPFTALPELWAIFLPLRVADARMRAPGSFMAGVAVCCECLLRGALHRCLLVTRELCEIL